MRAVGRPDVNALLARVLEHQVLVMDYGLPEPEVATRERFVLAGASPRLYGPNSLVVMSKKAAAARFDLKVYAEFEAVYLPWRENAVVTCELGSDDRVLLTSQLSGCTVGMDLSKTGVAAAFHINCLNASREIDEEASRLQVNKLTAGQHEVLPRVWPLVQRTDYKEKGAGSNEQATFIALRSTAGWLPFCQRAKPHEGVHSMVDLTIAPAERQKRSAGAAAGTASEAKVEAVARRLY